jgi:uncharacterized membrane protein
MAAEAFGVLCVLVVVLGLLGLTVVLPIVAFLRTQRIAELVRRVEQLEDAVRQGRLPAVSAEPAAPAVQVAPAAAEEPGEVITAEPVTVEPWRPQWDAAWLEAWIGRRGLGWIAVILLLFAAAFFIEYAFESQWLGELGRVTCGVLAGMVLCAVGWRYHRRGWRAFSQMLTAGGVVLLYLATFATFGYYHLLPREQAAVFLITLVIETAALAVFYEAPAVAIMAVIGGLLTPVLLHSDRDLYVNFFTYLLVLNAGVVGLALFRRWPAIGTIGLVGTQGLFWIWFVRSYHPEKLAAALGFQATLFGLYLAYGVTAHLIRRRLAGVEDLARLVVNGFLFAGAAYALLDEDYHVWMGTLAIGLAAVYAAFAWLVQRRLPEDARQLLVSVATSMAFLAAASPLQADKAWIPVAWAVQGLVLSWFGIRIGAMALRGLAEVLLLLAVGRLVFVDTPYNSRPPFLLLFNDYAPLALMVAACVLAAAALARRFLARLRPEDRVAMAVNGLLGVGLGWLVLSVDFYTFFQQIDQREAQTALSVVWAGYAALILYAGFRVRSDGLRWLALGLFGLTLGKVLVVDTRDLPGFYRVATFLVLSVMMAAAAWGYQKLQLLRQAAGREGPDHEAV